MNIAKINFCDVANGPGVRVSIFCCGCTNNCKGCFNPKAMDFEYGRKFWSDDMEQILESSQKDYISGLTLLGGEPFHPRNVGWMKDIAVAYRIRFGTSKPIWAYTGYKIEHLTTPIEKYGEDLFKKEGYQDYPYSQDAIDLLKIIDVLVDGRFEESLKDLTLPFRGSSNQRILQLSSEDVRKAYGLE